MDVYDLADAEGLTTMAVDSLALQIPSTTYRAEVCKAVAHAQLPHADETVRQKIQQEIEAGVKTQPPPTPPQPPVGGGSVPPAGLGTGRPQTSTKAPPPDLASGP